jgi:plastocyanin
MRFETLSDRTKNAPSDGAGEQTRTFLEESVSVPRILLAVPLLVAGALLPAVTGSPAPAPTGTVGMGHEGFSVGTVQIRRGGTLTFTNDSRWLHVIGPGEDGRISSEPGTPSLGPRGAFLSQSGQTYTTAKWNTPGTYRVTCSLHPEMTVTVRVTDS